MPASRARQALAQVGYIHMILSRMRHEFIASLSLSLLLGSNQLLLGSVKDSEDQVKVQLEKEKMSVMSSVLGEILASTAQKHFRVEEMHRHVQQEEHQLCQRRLQVTV
jgi:hypothetical protein